MVTNRVGRAGRWAVVGALASAGVLAIGGEAPAGPAKVARPVPELSAREARLVELGRRLFYEPGITLVGRNSCGSCHDPEHGFSDPAVKSRDDFNLTPRHSQALIDVDLKMPLHWDGSIRDLAEIVQRRTSLPGGGGYSSGFEGFESPLDVVARMGGTVGEPRPEAAAVARDLGPGIAVRNALAALPVQEVDTEDRHCVETSLADLQPVLSARYREAFSALDDPASAAQAIEAYVKSVRSTASAYDRHAAGEAGALSEAARRGLDLFRGRAGCAECHRLEPQDGWAMLRDGQYHNTGLAWRSRGTPPSVEAPAHVPAEVVASARRLLAEQDEGRAAVGGGTQGLARAFKTPTLRDVATHPPYMHDGSLATLADVVRHYAQGCGDDAERDAKVRKGFDCSERDVADLVAFLEALTSGERPGLARSAWAQRAVRTRLIFVDATGTPLAGLRVTLTPAGDRAGRAAPPKEPRVVTTDASGRVTFAPGVTTHVRLGLPEGVVPRDGALVPDTCEEARIVVPVRGRVRVALLLGEGREAPAALKTYPLAPLVEGQAASRAVEPEPWLLARTSDVEADGRSLPAYEGWVPMDVSSRVLFRVPGQPEPQEIDLAAGAVQRIEVR